LSDVFIGVKAEMMPSCSKSAVGNDAIVNLKNIVKKKEKISYFRF
jgi:hypothetical protein